MMHSLTPTHAENKHKCTQLCKQTKLISSPLMQSFWPWKDASNKWSAVFSNWNKFFCHDGLEWCHTVPPNFRPHQFLFSHPPLVTSDTQKRSLLNSFISWLYAYGHVVIWYTVEIYWACTTPLLCKNVYVMLFSMSSSTLYWNVKHWCGVLKEACSYWSNVLSCTCSYMYSRKYWPKQASEHSPSSWPGQIL